MANQCVNSYARRWSTCIKKRYIKWLVGSSPALMLPNDISNAITIIIIIIIILIFLNPILPPAAAQSQF